MIAPVNPKHLKPLVKNAAIAGVNNIRSATSRISGTADDAVELAAKGAGVGVLAETVAAPAAGISEQALNIGLIGTAFLPMIVGAAQTVVRLPGRAYHAVGSRLGFASPAPITPGKSWNEITFGETGFLGTATEKTVGEVAKRAGRLSDLTGFSGWQTRSHFKKADKYFTKARGWLPELSRTSIHEDLLPHLQKIYSVVESAPTVESVASQHGVRNAMDTIAKMQEEGHPAVAKVPKPVTKFLARVEDSMVYHGRAESWANVSESVKTLPKTVSNYSVTHGIANASFIAGSGISMFSDLRIFSQGLAALKQMYADLTGADVKKVSAIRVLFGKVPASVASARSYLWKNTFVKEASDAVAMGVNIKQIVDHRFGMGKAMGALLGAQAIGMGADAMMGGSVLPVYKVFSDAYKSGQAMTAEDYAQFIAMASQRYAKMGEKNPVTLTVAKRLAAEKAAPAAIMKMIDNGTLDKYGAEAAAMKDTETHQLLSGDRSKKERPVIGKHTGKLLKAADVGIAAMNFLPD